MRKTPYNVLIKIIVCGNMMSGKTRICRTIAGEDSESDNYEPTVGLDLFSISRFLDGNKHCKIHLLDTSGDHHYLPIIRSYFPACAMVLIVVDLKKGQTIEQVKEWIEESRESAKISNSRQKYVQIAIFANRNSDDTGSPKLSELCRTENVLFFEMDFGNYAEVSNAFDAIVAYIDTSFVRHFDKHPGIRYAGMSDRNYDESLPLISKPNGGISKQGCCSIL